MSYTKNRKPIEVFTFADGTTKFVWRTRHEKNCQSTCPCCTGDWDCSCGAVTWELKK